MAKEKEANEFEEKVLHINRCSKVVKGGRKFSFSALILIGDGKGRVGYGFAKANEVSDAIRKGSEAAKKNVITFESSDGTIPHEIKINHDGAKILMRPAKKGTGVKAGGKIRPVLELAGITDVVAKNQGSNNPINQVRAAFKALMNFKTKKQFIEERMGK
jgi:small subunit ribosomal protein S5